MRGVWRAKPTSLVAFGLFGAGLALLLSSSLGQVAYAALANLTASVTAYDRLGAPSATVDFGDVWPGDPVVLAPGVSFRVKSELEWRVSGASGDLPGLTTLAERPEGTGDWVYLGPSVTVVRPAEAPCVDTVFADNMRLEVGWDLAPGTYTATVSYVISFADGEPPVGTIDINNAGDLYTTSPSVTLNVSATDEASGIDAMSFRNGDGVWTEWQDFTPVVSWDLGPGDGLKTVWVRFRDRAGNESGPVGDSIILDTTFPTISGVAVSDRTASSALVGWQTTDEASTSQVEYGPTAAYGEMTALDPGLVTSHAVAVDGLAPGTLYHFRVRSADAAGNESISGDYTFYTFCDPPSNLTAVARRRGNTLYFDLSWDAADGAVSYRVYRRDVEAGGSWTLVASPAGTTWTDTLPGTLPFHLDYYVCAVNGGGDVSGPSNVVEAVGADLPPVISDVAAAPANTTATITWVTDKPATSQVRYGTSPGTYSETTTRDPAQVTGHSVVLTGLAPSTTYYYQVISTDISGHTAYSAEYSFTTLAPTVPAPPGNLRVDHVIGQGNKVVLAWDASEMATGYRLYSDDLLVPGVDFVLLIDTTGTTFTDGRYGPHGTYSYEYYVVAYNALGTSAESNHVVYTQER